MSYIVIVTHHAMYLPC